MTVAVTHQYRRVVVPSGHHEYQMGLQHRRTAGGEEHWSPDKSSQILFFANDAGVRFYTVSSELERRLIAAFDVRGAKYDAD